jgi:hypothetical protein
MFIYGLDHVWIRYFTDVKRDGYMTFSYVCRILIVTVMKRCYSQPEIIHKELQSWYDLDCNHLASHGWSAVMSE